MRRRWEHSYDGPPIIGDLDAEQPIERDVKTSVVYSGFIITARPLPLGSGEWNTEVRLMRESTVKSFYTSDTWKSEEEAVNYCLEFGKRLIDGEVPGYDAGDLP